MALRDASAALLLCVAFAAPGWAQGLAAKSGAQLRIEIAHFDASVEEGVARVTVEETFRNGGDRVEEGVFRFELPEDAVVGSFSMWMAGKEKRGRVMEAGRARATYDAIVRKQKDPGLLEQTGWREFAVNVFPIPAHDTVRVKLVYAHLVRDDLGLQTLELPLPQKCGAIGDLQVHVTVSAAHGVASIDCPSHRSARLAVAADHAEATFGGDGCEPDGPFVVRSTARGDNFDVALLADRAAGAEQGWFIARVVPRLAAPPAIARDVVFVIDRSGSMSGTKLDQARAALLMGLTTLKPGDRFDVVSFSSSAWSMGAGHLLDADEQNLARARRVAADLSASGGTAIAEALATALALNDGDAKRLFAVVFLTDGDPTVGETDPARILATFRKSAGATRLFAFGVGRDVKDFLLTKLAVEGRGEARYVREDENLEVPLAALFERVKTPLLLDPSLDIDGGGGEGGAGIEICDREPQRLPDLFQGRALVVAGRFKGSGKATMHLRGRSGGRDVDLAIPVEFPEATPPRPHVAQIWAKARVERLLDDMRALGPNVEMRREVVALGLAHQLVTPLTSFLVVEEGTKLAGGSDVIDRLGAEPADEGTAFNGDPTLREDYSADPTALSQLPVAPPSAFAGRRAGSGGRGGGGLGAASLRGLVGRTDASTRAACEWLDRHRSDDGHWDAKGFMAHCRSDGCDGGGDAAYDVAVTGLALLAFLGDGETHQSGPFRPAVLDGVRHLRAIEAEDGALAPPTAPDSLRQHAIAALALVEDYGTTQAEELKEPCARALDYALKAQSVASGWQRADGSLDVETTGWMAMLLRSAKAAGFAVDPQALSDAARAFDALTDPATGRVVAPKRVGERALSDSAATAIALVVRILAGHAIATDPAIDRGADLLAKDPPQWDPAGVSVDFTYWNFGALALFQLGGARFGPWFEALKTATLSHQHSDAKFDAFGSWDPVGPGAPELGRIGATALNALMFESVYRYPRIFPPQKK